MLLRCSHPHHRRGMGTVMTWSHKSSFEVSSARGPFFSAGRRTRLRHGRQRRISQQLPQGICCSTCSSRVQHQNYLLYQPGTVPECLCYQSTLPSFLQPARRLRPPIPLPASSLWCAPSSSPPTLMSPDLRTEGVRPQAGGAVRCRRRVTL